MYVLTETRSGEEVEVARDTFPKLSRLLAEYSEKDMQDLRPCVYKELPSGELTTEF